MQKAKSQTKRLPLIQVPVDQKFLDEFDRLREREGKPSRVALARKIVMNYINNNKGLS